MSSLISTWSLARIVGAVSGELQGDGRVTSVSTDSRTSGQDSLFVALVGDRFDGHEFVQTAIDTGSSALLVSKPVQSAKAMIRVEDTLEGLQSLARALWSDALKLGMRSIALTGSNGKTTTKELMLAVAKAGYDSVHATLGNLNNHIGVPLTLCALPADCELAIVEMGANRFGDIRELVMIAPAQVRVITSIGAAHLEVLGDLEGVRRVKSEVFENLSEPAVAVIPVEEADRLEVPAGLETITFGEAGDFGYEVFAAGPNSQHVRMTTPDEVMELELPLVGIHNASNLACALAAIWAVERRLPSAARIQEELNQLELPGGRFRRVESGEWTFIDDAYNANPSSVVASFSAFTQALTTDRTAAYAVVGEMGELGDHALALHVDTAQNVARIGGVEEFVFVGRFAQQMAAAAIELGVNATGVVDPVDAASHLRNSTPGIVFIKASRSARLERVIEMIHSRPWS